VQYTRRLLPPYAGKTAVIVHDHADTNIPHLRNMLNKRLKSYRALGFSLPSNT
jgi:hypothetical protein